MTQIKLIPILVSFLTIGLFHRSALASEAELPQFPDFLLSQMEQSTNPITPQIDLQVIFALAEKEGIPSGALKKIFNFIEQNEGHFLSVKKNNNQKDFLKLTNKKFIAIADLSKPSSEKRLFILNLENGQVEKYYVAHGLNSGGTEALHFSNISGSKQSSLGVYLTGPQYVGRFGLSMKLYGLEESNDNAYERTIVFHGADYISPEFLKKNGHMGRSFGCPAVEKAAAQYLIPILKDGTLLLLYHEAAMALIPEHPSLQQIDTVDFDSNQIAPTDEEANQ